MRELTDGEQAACRNRAIDKVKKYISALPKNLSAEEKWANLSAFFNKQSKCMEAPAENFDRDKFFARGHDELTPGGDLRCMIGGNLTGLKTLEAITKEMATCGDLSKVNGTSMEFQKCVAFVQEQMIRFERNKEMFETNGAAYKPAQKPLSPAVLKARVFEIITSLLFIPDLLTA